MRTLLLALSKCKNKAEREKHNIESIGWVGQDECHKPPFRIREDAYIKQDAARIRSYGP